jgi:hypothetical protein
MPFILKPKLRKEREKESRGEMRTNEKCLKVCAEANTILNPFIVKVKRQLFLTLFVLYPQIFYSFNFILMSQ